ncbi:hypothetical protein TWF718_008136 [Orbilia javanica]|uniref:Uncharacterized protein n=1 Tax=Orbilia javanica TaxID=47235 RepID=A0AAN8RCV9_9PEZI
MAHVAKRPRLHEPKNPTLTLPATTPKLRNLQAEHENSLRQSAQRLKTSWEDICRRYGRDFGGEGDEIDLRTGEVVVDNGHLRGLEEDLEGTWGGGDEDEEGDDAGSATSSLEMELLARRPMLARDEMGGPMLRDDEAEEIDVDEDLDRDAIDDLFDELELATGFTGKEKRRREKDQKIQEAQGSTSKEIGQDSIPSPASSELAEEDENDGESSTAQHTAKEAATDVGALASLDELPPDDVMLEYVTKLGRQKLLALVQTLQGTEELGNTGDPAMVAQLTPISDCGKPLFEQLGEAVEKLAASKEPLFESLYGKDALEHELEQASDDKGNGNGGLELGSDLEPPAEAVPCSEDVLDHIVEAPPTIPSETPMVEDPDNIAYSTEITISSTSDPVGQEQELPVDIGSELRPEPELEPEVEPKSTAEPEAELEFQPEQTPAQPTNVHVLPQEEPPVEPISDPTSSVDHKLLEESQTSAMENREPDPKFHYGDIDDLSTIIVPKALVPVTPKNRLYGTKLSGSSRKGILSKKQSRRRLSETITPKRIKLPLSSKQKAPRTVPSKPRPTIFNAGASPKSAGPRNFWSALPGDPFYDPQWQDSHPDGEPAFEEFERRRILLEEHAGNGAEEKEKPNDDLMVLDSSPARKKKERKTSSKMASKAKEPKTPTSKRVKYDDEVEKKLHTPRSGKFLEYINNKAAKERGVSRIEVVIERPCRQDEAAVTTPTIRPEYGRGLSESEGEEDLSAPSKNPPVLGDQVRKRTRGRPKKGPVPLIVPDPPASSSRALRSQMGLASDPLQKCGETGYRCEKALCFKCIDD